jgi:hypothetical protein
LGQNREVDTELSATRDAGKGPFGCVVKKRRTAGHPTLDYILHLLRDLDLSQRHGLDLSLEPLDHSSEQPLFHPTLPGRAHSAVDVGHPAESFILIPRSWLVVPLLNSSREGAYPGPHVLCVEGRIYVDSTGLFAISPDPLILDRDSALLRLIAQVGDQVHVVGEDNDLAVLSFLDQPTGDVRPALVIEA